MCMRIRQYLLLALSFGLSLGITVQAAETTFTAPNGRVVNPVIDGKVIKAGTYFNTKNGKITFTNKTFDGSLWLKGGDTVRGLNVDVKGIADGNGGNIHIYAPNSVVRLDGDIDVNGFNRSDGFKGSGGRVFIDAAYLYQNGNIFAKGWKGGLVQFNVGSAAFNRTAKVEARGMGAGGGIITVNASGPVDIKRGVIMDTSTGKQISGNMARYDTNVINIEGSLVNIEGVLRADGFRPERGGTDGGTVRLVSTGQTDLSQTKDAIHEAALKDIFTKPEASQAEARLTQLQLLYDGDIRIASDAGDLPAARILANAGNFIVEDSQGNGNGGTVIASAQRDVLNGGEIQANGSVGVSDTNDFIATKGGDGGTVVMLAGRNIHNSGRIVTDGGKGADANSDLSPREGGTGGLQAYSYGAAMFNKGVVRAMGGQGGTGSPDIDSFPFSDARGGHGGLVVFSGPSNPTSVGVVLVTGGLPGGPTGARGAEGVAVMSNPLTSTFKLIGIGNQLKGLELLSNRENLILLRNGHPLDVSVSGSDGDKMENWMNSARVRTPSHPNLTAPPPGKDLAWAEIVEKSHILTVDEPAAIPAIKSSSLAFGETDIQYFRPYMLRNFMLGNTTNRYFEMYDYPKHLRPYTLHSVSGGDVSFRPTLLTSLYNTMTFHSQGDTIASIEMGLGIAGPHFSSISRSFDGGLISLGSLRPIDDRTWTGGSFNVAADQNIGFRGTNVGLKGIFHGGSNVMKAGSSILVAAELLANGGLVGGTHQLFSRQIIRYQRDITANGDLQGGSILLRSSQVINEPSTAEILKANGGEYGGLVKLVGIDSVIPGVIEANGKLGGGTVIILTGK